MAAIAPTNVFPIAYLIRHPVAVALSEVRAQQADKLPTKRQEILAQLLRDSRPDLSKKFADRIDGMSLFERNIMLWRLDTERVPAKLMDDGKIHLVIYETLCLNMLRETETLLAHFDLDMHEQVRMFIEQLESGDKDAKGMFSVHKQPKETAFRWQKNVTSEQLAQAAEILEGSHTFAWGVDRGDWPAFV